MMIEPVMNLASSWRATRWTADLKPFKECSPATLVSEPPKAPLIAAEQRFIDVASEGVQR
jgi:hypothetical protein